MTLTGHSSDKKTELRTTPHLKVKQQLSTLPRTCCLCVTDEAFGGKYDDENGFCHRLFDGKTEYAGWDKCHLSIVGRGDYYGYPSLAEEVSELIPKGACTGGISTFLVGHSGSGAFQKWLRALGPTLERCPKVKNVKTIVTGCNAAQWPDSQIATAKECLLKGEHAPQSVTLVGEQCFSPGNPEGDTFWSQAVITANASEAKIQYGSCDAPYTKECGWEEKSFNKEYPKLCTGSDGVVHTQFCCPSLEKYRSGSPVYKWGFLLAETANRYTCPTTDSLKKDLDQPSYFHRVYQWLFSSDEVATEEKTSKKHTTH